jgi:CheY-like chemotaxis protein
MARILFVDDEEEIRRVAVRVLEGAGHEVAQAGNGIEAMRLVGVGDCDLVVLDMVMPEKEGAETVREIRRGHPKLPVLAISGVVNAAFYLTTAKHLGATATLRKPFTPQELLESVAELLARRN